MSVKLYHGDCLEILPTLEADSVDTCITDPPYGLNFMGKDWDHGVPGERFWREVLRVLKPGAMLLAFGGTRTHHRLMVAIEDAGFETRDVVMWVYGSGFPKSHNISAAIDKANGREFEDRYELGRHIRECREQKGISRKEVSERFGAVAVCNHWEAQDRNNASPPTPEDWNQIKEWLGCDVRFDALVDRIGAERDVIGKQTGAMSGWSMDGTTKFVDRDITAPATDAARLWDGWGTALKPAWEPIILAMKPRDGTFAANALKWGVAGLNVDGARVEGPKRGTGRKRDSGVHLQAEGWGTKSLADEDWPNAHKGRWPANLIHDGSEEVVALFPQTGKSRAGYRGAGLRGHGRYGLSDQSFNNISEIEDNGGSAARFFKACPPDARRLYYAPKASRSERNAGLEGMEERHIRRMSGGEYAHNSGSTNSSKNGAHSYNHHPTVKPLSLMRYLCRLTATPTGGVVLDPFFGSGTTGCAAVLEGRDFFGIELDAEYMEIARRRIAYWQGVAAEQAATPRQLPLDVTPRE